MSRQAMGWMSFLDISWLRSIVITIFIVIIEHLAHIWSIQVVAQSFVVASDSHATDNTHLLASMLGSVNSLCFLHQQCSITLVLEFALVSAMNRDS